MVNEAVLPIERAGIFKPGDKFPSSSFVSSGDDSCEMCLIKVSRSSRFMQITKIIRYRVAAVRRLSLLEAAKTGRYSPHRAYAGETLLGFLAIQPKWNRIDG